MAARAVVFDIGGVLEVPTDTDLDGRSERRVGLRPGEFFQRLRRSGLGREANLGRRSAAEFAQALGRLYGLDEPTTDELLAELWDWYVGELNTEMADYFRRLRPRYRTAILSNAAEGGRARRTAATASPPWPTCSSPPTRSDREAGPADLRDHLPAAGRPSERGGVPGRPGAQCGGRQPARDAGGAVSEHHPGDPRRGGMPDRLPRLSRAPVRSAHPTRWSRRVW